jgi:hypothetical protein
MKSWKKFAYLALFSTTTAFAQEINLSGFASAHITQQLGGTGNASPEYYSRAADYYSFTKFGLNVASKLDEQWSIQSQLLVSGKRIDIGAETPQWNMYANWLFLAYRPNDNLRFRLGRQLFPAWLVSEFIDVGYMYPWTETPHAIYQLSPFKSLNGLSSDYTFQLTDSHKMNVMIFGGQEEIRIPLSSGGNEDNSYGNIFGAEVSLTHKNYKFRIMGTNYRIKSTANNSDLENNSVTVLTSGLKYEKNNWMLYTEYGLSQGSKNGTPITGANLPYDGIQSRPFAQKAYGGYLTIGHWFNSWLPHLTVSESKWETGTVEGHEDLYAFGLNKKINDNIIFKTNIGYTISGDGPGHMTEAGDATTWVGGFDMIF